MGGRGGGGRGRSGRLRDWRNGCSRWFGGWDKGVEEVGEVVSAFGL